MKITAISAQIRNNNRVNVSVDDKYRFSLDIYQLVDLGIKVGNDYEEADLIALEQESQFGKVYGRALEYCLMRPHSAKEMKDYLYRKTRPKLDKDGQMKSGVPTETTGRVFDRLVERGYIDDQKFATYWVENRSLTKGLSRRKLIAELRINGIASATIEQSLSSTERNDVQEIKKIIAKKRSRYSDQNKLIIYLARQGFSYDVIKQSIGEDDL